MILLRCLAGCGLLVATFLLAFTTRTDALLMALATGFLLFWATRRPLGRALLAAMPVAVTAVLYYLLQLLAGSTAIMLPLKMLVVFLYLSTVLRIFPWDVALSRSRPGSHGFQALLYIHFIGHFVHVFGEETLRVLRAWKWSSRGARGSVRLRALRGTLSGLFLRSLGRAERFYAAQLVRGLAE